MGFADRVKDTSTTTGTGNLTLSGSPPTGFVAFGTAYAVNDPFTYTIDDGAGNWEVGYGYLSGSTTLVRDRVVASSNSGALVNFGAGSKTVFVTYIAEDAISMGWALAFQQGLAVS